MEVVYITHLLRENKDRINNALIKNILIGNLNNEQKIVPVPVPDLLKKLIVISGTGRGTILFQYYDSISRRRSLLRQVYRYMSDRSQQSETDDPQAYKDEKGWSNGRRRYETLGGLFWR